MKKFHQTKVVLAGLLLSSSFVPVATAEDIEIYTSLGSAANSSNPNIMFIVDTSGSMGTTSNVKASYSDSTTYSGSCAATGIYFVDNGKKPDCATNTDYFDRSALVCDHAVVGYEADVYDVTTGAFISKGVKITPPQDGSLIRIGTYSDQLAQWDSVKNKWRELTVGTTAERAYPIECFSDSGVHGVSSAGSNYYIEDGGTGYTSTTPANREVPHAVWAGGSGNLQLFNGNYINYLNDTTVPMVSKSYLDQVKTAVEIMVRGNTRVDIGLMRFDGKANNASNGGAVLYPILDVGADRNDFFSRLNALTAKSYTPLSEVYYEALLYFGGKPADFSLLSNPSNQVTNRTMMPGNQIFRSPISSTCDKNYIVMLSDGQPTKDDLNNTRQGVLPGFTVGSCSSDITASTGDDNRDAFSSGTSTVDNCLDELAEWGFTKDILVDDAARSETIGDQNVFTHTIGFQLSDLSAIQLMTETAQKGGGDFYQASSESELIEIFNKIVASALQVNTTFSSPAVSVNAFNRSTHLDDLYFTLFKPSDDNHWAGNLKKYKLDFEPDPNDAAKIIPFIADQNGAHAVNDGTGFFADTAKSFWTPGGDPADGKDVTVGGAVSVLTASRNVLTFTGSYNDDDGVYTPDTPALTAATNLVKTSNASLTDSLLGIAGFPEIVTGTPYRTTIINWAAGRDALSQFGTANTYNDVRPEMGDPLHSEPALVQYGGTVTNPDLVIFTATNDGYVHAIDADTGVEEFAFIPQELLPNLVTAMENPGGKKLYGLDGSVAAWINDINGDGIINGSDHVYLYVSMRRGGKNIYALDVTSRSQPELLWFIKGGKDDYQELGDSWSTVNIEKIKDGSTDKTVLIFGGGYDPAQDNVSIRTKDNQGRAVFIADATTGERLWIGSDGGDTDVDEMEYSIPARVTTLDVSGDGYIDRLYVVDMGGQVFRFDIDNKNNQDLDNSISGGRIADLAGSLPIDARRFYYPPDVALVEGKGGAYHAIVAASGYRAHPLNDVIHDRIYMLKDNNRGLLPDTTNYATKYAGLLSGNIHDATNNLAGGDAANDTAREAELASIAGSDGWFIDLEDEANPGSWIGEKSLSEPLIIEGQVIVTTYTPNVASVDVCQPSLGLGKVYTMDILDATPTYPANTDERDKRHIELKFPGIPPTPNVMITDKGIAECVGADCNPLDIGLGVRKTYWYEVEK